MTLPNQTDRNLLHLIIQAKPFNEQHRLRVKHFIDSFLKSTNKYLFFIGERARNFTCGPVGRNFARFNCESTIGEPSIDLCLKSQAIAELIDVRDGHKVIPGMSRADVELMIVSLCCN